jgi:hypothetical protein
VERAWLGLRCPVLLGVAANFGWLGMVRIEVIYYQVLDF